MPYVLRNNKKEIIAIYAIKQSPNQEFITEEELEKEKKYKSPIEFFEPVVYPYIIAMNDTFNLEARYEGFADINEAKSFASVANPFKQVSQEFVKWCAACRVKLLELNESAKHKNETLPTVEEFINSLPPRDPKRKASVKKLFKNAKQLQKPIKRLKNSK